MTTITLNIPNWALYVIATIMFITCILDIIAIEKIRGEGK